MFKDKTEEMGFYLCEATVNLEFLLAKLKPIVGETTEVVDAEEFLERLEKYLHVKE